jgi:hypothetical protein
MILLDKADDEWWHRVCSGLCVPGVVFMSQATIQRRHDPVMKEVRHQRQWRERADDVRETRRQLARCASHIEAMIESRKIDLVLDRILDDIKAAE